MSDTYRNQIYEARKNTLMAAGMSEDTAHDMIKSISAAEKFQYLHDESLRKRLLPAEEAGRIIDIYNNMYTEDRIRPFLLQSMEQREAIELSIRLHDTEKIIIEKFDRDNAGLKERRDALIEQAGKALNELKPYVNDGAGIQQTIDSMQNNNVPEALAYKYYINDALRNPVGQDSPVLKAALTLDGCRDELMAGGMPEAIADTRIVESAIETERALAAEAEFTDGVESIQEPDVKYEV